MARQNDRRGIGGVGRGAMRARGRTPNPISAPTSPPPGMAVRANTPAGPKAAPITAKPLNTSYKLPSQKSPRPSLDAFKLPSKASPPPSLSAFKLPPKASPPPRIYG